MGPSTWPLHAGDRVTSPAVASLQPAAVLGRPLLRGERIMRYPLLLLQVNNGLLRGQLSFSVGDLGLQMILFYCQFI
jgi:hypothetical protein